MELQVIQITYETSSKTYTYRLVADPKRGVLINRRRVGDTYIPPLIENWSGEGWSGSLTSVRPRWVKNLDEAQEIIERAEAASVPLESLP